MELSIVIPAYNEEKRLPRTLERIFSYLGAHYRGAYEVVVVDDGSQDRTSEVVGQLAASNPQLRLITFERNRGRGVVVRDGIFAARGEFVLEADADGSVAEEAIVRFLDYFREHRDVDMLTGSRTVPGALIVTPQPWLRVALGWAFLLLARIMFGWPLYDRINGFKMFPHHVARDIFSHTYESSFFGEAEVVYVAECRGWRVKELPVSWSDNRDSRIRPLREAWRSFWGMFRVLWRDWHGVYTSNQTR
ncbi:glycosyltransferase [Candidatus Parcubacteria bacterium]|nr:glycosyltransferase [Candidatus Parcubacteria bacterium]